MRKRVRMFLLAVMLCILSAMPVLAGEGQESEVVAEEYLRLIDTAELLTDKEAGDLLKALDKISERQKMEVAVVTVENTEGMDIVDYADNLYEDCSYGYGPERDGVMLLISMEGRDWHITACGYGITAFTDAGIKHIGEMMLEDLSNGNYAAAFFTYAEQCDRFITQARTGKPYDGSNLPHKPLSPIWIPLSVIIGIVIAFLSVGSMKGKLKTVRQQAAANSYVRTGSMNITQSREYFLYSQVERTEKQKNNGSGSGKF